MLEKVIEFQTVDGKSASLTVRNTMRQAIRFAVMLERFAGDEHPDVGYRSQFCYVMARAVQVKGLDWELVDETATPDEFTACYYAFSEHVTQDAFVEIIKDVDAMLAPVANATEKPDSALTEDEVADPN